MTEATPFQKKFCFLWKREMMENVQYASKCQFKISLIGHLKMHKQNLTTFASNSVHNISLKTFCESTVPNTNHS